MDETVVDETGINREQVKVLGGSEIEVQIIEV